MLTPRAPRWAILGGLPEPEPNEPYDIYWGRVGAPNDVIAWSLDVRPGAEDVGNDRMATWLRLTKPGWFLEEVYRMAYRSNIPPHRIGVVRS